MNRILVWDLPTRIFHWILSLAVVGALGIALIADNDSSVFQVHMLLGLLAGFLVALRVFWGLVGSRYARFTSFLFGPKALLEYLWGTSRNTAARHIGHNPGSAYAIFAMLVAALGLAVTGPLLASQASIKEVHEVLAYGMLAAIAAHLAGIVIHTIRHRENIILGMLDGKKAGEPAQAIRSSHVVVGLVLVVLVAGWAAMVVGGHNGNERRLTLFGQTIRLGDAEREGGHGRQGEHRGEGHGERERQGGHDD